MSPRRHAAAARWVAGLATVVAVAGPARAEISGLVAANVVEGATSNALLAPDGSAAIGPDAFTTVRASAAARFQGRRQGQTLSYTYAANFFVDHPEGNSQTHLLTWALDAVPTPRTVVLAQAGGSYGVLSSVNPIAAALALNPQAAGETGFAAVPTGAVTYFNATGTATGQFRQTPTLAWQETTAVNVFEPTAGPVARTLGLTQDFRHEHQWLRDTLTIDLLLGYLDASSFTAAPGNVVPRLETLQAQLLVGGRRELAPSLSGSLEVGALILESRTADLTSFGPAGRATLHYQRELTFAELLVAHMPQLNVYLGQTLVSDAVTLRSLLPLDRAERFRLVAFGTAQRGSVITGGGFEPAIDLLAADVGFLYQPVTTPLMASVDYNLEDQIGHAVGSTVFPSLHRQMVMVTLTGTLGTYTPWRSQSGANASAGGNQPTVQPASTTSTTLSARTGE
jgi:hypothetical protein